RRVRVLLDQVPLVRHDDEAAPGLPGALGDAQVLRVDRLGRIDEEQADVGPPDRSLGPERAVVLQTLVDPRLAPETCRIDEDQRPAVITERRVHGISRRAGHIRYDQALLAEEPVDEARLPD